MEYSLFTKLAAEFVGTAVLMIFGNGAVANVELKNTKGHNAGWLNIAMGYGFGVMFPVLMFGGQQKMLCKVPNLWVYRPTV